MIEKNKILNDLQNNKNFKYQDSYWIFVGVFKRSAQSLVEKLAWNSYKGQEYRCRKNIGNYKNVEVMWALPEYITWYANELLTRDFWKKPVCARYNDIGNYETTNCRLLENGENSTERNLLYDYREQASNTEKANIASRKLIRLIDVNTKEMHLFGSMYSAAQWLGRSYYYLHNCKHDETVARSVDGGHFYFGFWNGKKWEDYLFYDKTKNRNKNRKNLETLGHFLRLVNEDGVVHEFKSIQSLCRFAHRDYSYVKNRIANENIVFYLKGSVVPYKLLHVKEKSFKRCK